MFFHHYFGGALFAIPYIGLGLNLIPSLAIGIVAYGAGNLIFKEKGLEVNLNNQDNLYETLKKAKEMVKQLNDLSYKLEKQELSEQVRRLCEISNKIIDTISKKPEKLVHANTFLNYYLPVTIKIISRYDEIENQQLNTEESRKFMKSIQNMMQKIEHAFTEQLNNMYKTEMIDTDAELKVFETMLKSDGFVDEFDLKISNGGENIEK